MAVNPNINVGQPPFLTPMQSNGQLAAAWVGWFNQVGSLIGQLPTISDTSTKMVPVGGGLLPTDYAPDAWARFVYYQTDTGQVFVSRLVANVWTWVRILGIMTVASPASLPVGLGVADANLLVFENTYFHTYQWTGVAWRFAPGDPGSRYIVATAAAAPLGGLWQLCDGSTVLVSQGDGTTANVTVPNLMASGVGGGASLIGAGGTLGFAAASVPSWQAAAVTDAESAHTHPLTNQIVQAGAGQTVALNGSTGAGTSHSHALTDANALLKKPSDTTDATHGGGMPDRFYLQWYLRR